MNLVRTAPALHRASLDGIPGLGYIERVVRNDTGCDFHGVIVFDEGVDMSPVENATSSNATFKGVVYNKDGLESHATIPVSIVFVSSDAGKEPGMTFVSKSIWMTSLN